MLNLNGKTEKNPVFWNWLVVLVLLAILAGCAAEKYSAAADKEVYGILNDRRASILGATNQFNIETHFSKRDPQDVNGSEIVLDRYRGGKRVLTLNEALELAVKANRTYQNNREKLYLQALSLTGTRHQFALKFTKASADLGLERGTDGGIKGDSDVDITLQKMFRTGGVITATLANDLVLYFDGKKPKVPALTLSLTQPLLRGAGAEIAAEILTQAERDVIYEVRTFSHYQKEFAVEVVNSYVDLLQQGESMRLSYINYTNKIYFSKEVDARVNAGLQSEFEAKQAKQSEFSAKLSYIGSTNTYQNSLDDFKQKLSLPLGTGIKLDFKALDDLNAMGLPEVQVSDRVGYRLAITNRLDLLNVIDQFEDSKRKVRVAKKDLLPSLSIVADAELRDQYYSSFQPEEFKSSAGLKLDLPLDQLSERNAYRTSIITFERQLRTLATELDKLRDGVRTDVRNLSRLRQNYFTQLDAMKNAEENLIATRQRLRLGFPGVRTRDILTAQDQLLQAQLAVSRAMVDYHKTRLKLLKDVGILDITQDDFWLKATSVPGAAGPGPPAGGLQDVIPPEQILGQ